MQTNTRHAIVSLLLAALVGACVALAIPVSGKGSQHELSHLMSLLGKLKGAHRARQSEPSSLTRPDVVALGSLRNDDVVDDEDDIMSEISQDSLHHSEGGASSVNKRQGAWSFDYGLGGGRFGKRSYAYDDYGLGGGRYGRDVDHVDPHHEMDAGL